MSTIQRQSGGVRDLIEEAKKRIVILVVCVVGLSYFMSMTSSSVLVNLPAAALLIIMFRYLSLDFEMRRKVTCIGKPTFENNHTEIPHFGGPGLIAERSSWQHKVNSPIVEEAIDHFSRHIVSEMVTDLWYSRITSDRQGPEELVLIMNGVFGELSSRLRNLNLIDLITRDIINLISKQMELFRSMKAKIEMTQSRILTVEERDIELKSVLAADNKLHPALFSAENEHKVLQLLVDGLMFFSFKEEELQCSLFHYITRELLACAVIRPVVNLANPRFINERIESLAKSISKTDIVNKKVHEASLSRVNGPSQVSSTDSLDPSIKGVELMQLKKENNKCSESYTLKNANQTVLSKDPLLSLDTRSTRSWSSLPEVQNREGRDTQLHSSGGEWGGKIDPIFQKKTEAMAPEHFDLMWEKGKNYNKESDKSQQADPKGKNSVTRLSNEVESSKVLSCPNKNEFEANANSLDRGVINSGCNEFSGKHSNSVDESLVKKFHTSVSSLEEKCEPKDMSSEEVESLDSSSSEDEDIENVTGLDSPGVKVWDGKNKKKSSRIHHPLETLDSQKNIKTRKGLPQHKKFHRAKPLKKRSRLGSHKGHIWQEVERKSYLLEDGQDILNSSDVRIEPEHSNDDSEADMSGRVFSGATTSPSLSWDSLPGSYSLSVNSETNPVVNDSFLKLRCEVLGANIVKSGSKTLAVYSISVTDVDSNSWTIKRRFQHFEELHRRLKEFPEYHLHLPPKHFLSTGLDAFVIRERCLLLDQYLKKLVKLPTISSSIEVWDFLSVDSQLYVFLDSLSIIEAIPVDFNGTRYEMGKDCRGNYQHVIDQISSKRESIDGNQNLTSQIQDANVFDVSRQNMNDETLPSKMPGKKVNCCIEDSNGFYKSEPMKIPAGRDLQKAENGDMFSIETTKTNLLPQPPNFIQHFTSTIPSEWVPPNLSVPLLDFIDVILQLKDGGWIRRKIFWVAKQVFQVGMSDALDDWLIEKIQLLRHEATVVSGIRRLEQILWPDGIFITKHPKRQQPSAAGLSQKSSLDHDHTPVSSPKPDNIQNLEEMQQNESERRAKLVYELMIDKAPAAIVSLIGSKEYEKCAKDLYYFIQSSVFMKQLGFELVELLVSSAFPELDYDLRKLDKGKEKLGEL